MMNRKEKKHTLVLIITGVAVLAVILLMLLLQFRSVKKAAMAEQEQIERTLRREIFHAISESTNEIRSFFFMMRPVQEGLENPAMDNPIGFNPWLDENLHSWKELVQESFSSLELCLWMPQDNGLYCLDPQDGWVYKEQWDNLQYRPDQGNPMDFLTQFPGKLVFLQGWQRNPSSESPLLLVMVDSEEFWGGNLMDSLNNLESNYEFQVHELSNDQVYGEITLGKEVFYRYQLDRPLDLFSPGQAFPFDSHERGGRPSSELEILVYHNQGSSLEGYMRNWIWQNMTLLFVLSLLLLLCYFFLLFLYGRNRRLQVREQEFVATVSHELRTPISVVKSASDNLSSGTIKSMDRVRYYGAMIEEEADRLARMVDNILIYGRMDQLVVEPNTQEIYLHALLEEWVERIKNTSIAQKRDLNLHLEGAPVVVKTDRQALDAIFQNLIINGLRHGISGPITIIVDTIVPLALRIRIEDHGPGIPKREQKKIFEPFIRGGRSREDQVAGSGLGLHITKNLVNLLKGSLKLESPYELPNGGMQDGCRFTVILPMEEYHA